MIAAELAGATPAVLVIDMQAVFVSPDGPFSNTTAGPLCEALNRFLDGVRRLRLPVVFCNYLLRADLADAGLLRDSPAAPAFAEGAPFAGVDPRLKRADGDLEIRHNRPGCFHQSDLDAVLRGLDADTVILTGVSVNNAISTTAREAFARDLPAFVVRDCVGAAPWEPEDLLESYFDTLATWTAKVADAKDVLAALEAAR